MTRCLSSAPDLHTIQCQHDHGHDGLHRNNMVTWTEPQIVTVDGVAPDLTVNTVHWVDGDVRLSGERA